MLAWLRMRSADAVLVGWPYHIVAAFADSVACVGIAWVVKEGMPWGLAEMMTVA